MNLYTYAMVADAMREHAYSARPDAPVVPDRISRHPGRRRGASVDQARRLTARALRRIADRVEPCPQPAHSP
ncbi:MAG TPA: hypothetical protein VKZ65_13935 [Glycomyces sp.]|nr:hypothetical protein [Glycomyces sp.]